VTERKSLEILITKGMPDKGAKVTLRGASDESPGAETGDVVFHVRVQPHPVFKRLHQHLLIEKDIPLVGALTGVAFSITHLDGRTLHITSRPGEVIQPGSFKLVPGAGMPLASNHYRFGDLLIRFTVIFPPSTAFLRSPADIAAIEKLLPATMDAGALAESREKRRAGKKEEEEEDEDGMPSAGGGGGAGATASAAEDSPVITGPAARAPRAAASSGGAASPPAAKKPATGSKGGSKGGASSSGGGGEEGEESAPVDEDVTMAACDIASKLEEAKSMQGEDSR
jgi:hypothetical protein